MLKKKKKNRKKSQNPKRHDENGKDIDCNITLWDDGAEFIKKRGIETFIRNLYEIDAGCQFFPSGLIGGGCIYQSKHDAMKTFDIIFTMNIQREPYNYRSNLDQLAKDEMKRYFIDKDKKQTKDFIKAQRSGNKLMLLKQWIKSMFIHSNHCSEPNHYK